MHVRVLILWFLLNLKIIFCLLIIQPERCGSMAKSAQSKKRQSEYDDCLFVRLGTFRKRYQLDYHRSSSASWVLLPSVLMKMTIHHLRCECVFALSRVMSFDAHIYCDSAGFLRFLQRRIHMHSEWYPIRRTLAARLMPATKIELKFCDSINY